ncbi:MAG TPA: hypothetical protein VFY21_04845 [Xanthobacteraceae bacterium]|nr:hypothetical protein [Xanthobacteraceae bacterium]
MPAINILDLIDLTRATLFQATRHAFQLRDRLAAARDRVPSPRDVSGSTALAYLAVVVMSGILVKELLAPTPAISSVSPTPDKRPEWIEIARPYGSFALEAPELEGLETQYSVRRHRSGGGRRDTLTFGGPEASGAYMRMSLYRPGDEGRAEPDSLEAAAALAAASGINAEIQDSSGKLKTKFGALPIVNMRVESSKGWRNCIAVAGGWNDPRFGLVAWWCNEGPEMVDLGEFACVIDRTALMSAGGDERLAEFFARAELMRNYCGGQGSFVSATPRLGNDWIHAKRGPGLRGRLSAR